MTGAAADSGSGVLIIKEVEIYTDGACSGNPGPGGYGTILKYGPHEKEISGACENTTNNRMELMAAIKGLEHLNEPCKVTLYSDSRYLVDAMTKGWVEKWRSRGWTTICFQTFLNFQFFNFALYYVLKYYSCRTIRIKLIYNLSYTLKP